MSANEASSSRNEVLKLPEFRFLLAASGFSTLASRALAVVIGFQIYEITHDPLSIGWLGLVEAIPAISIALFGGHVADRSDRRLIVLITQLVSVACTVFFAVYTGFGAIHSLLPIYAVIFIAGVARGFSDPASGAFEAQVVPREHMVNGSAWLSSSWQSCSIVGPALGGISYAKFGVQNTYWIIAALFVLSWISIFCIAPKPIPVAEEHESIWESIAGGVKYVFGNQVLVGSMALDLFAVLFGGAIALLPIFAKDILKVGPEGLGFLTAAPSVGALSMTLWATHRPPTKNAGKTFMLCVFGFGIAMIVFALSRNFVVSLIALAASGAFDGVSVIIRKSILRLMTPDHLRGRVSSVNMIFIGSSNEIGAFESGVGAKLLGTVRSVWLGGIVTLIVVAVTAIAAPKLRNLDLGEEQKKKAL
ncbi:MAG: MFS transporter [Chthonomonadaceae bacterium]|nr:MFS transporter [Chthonomonadaceae bacterium]